MKGDARPRTLNHSLSMVVCAFNEEELIEEFLYKSIGDLSRATSDWEILLVNDGSSDRTSELAHRIAREWPQIRIFDQPFNRGPGACIQLGYYAATKDYVFHNTVDAFFNTEDLMWVLPLLRHYDCLSGYRKDLKANNLYQKLLTTCNRGLIHFLFPLKLKAYQTVQFHPRELFQRIRVEAKSSFVSAELLLKAHGLGYRVGEFEVEFHPRTKGVAKGGGPIHVARSIRDIFKYWFLWVVLKRPMVRPFHPKVEGPSTSLAPEFENSVRIAG